MGGLIPREEHNALLRAVLPQIEARAARPQDRIRVVFEGGFCEQPPLDLLRSIGQSCYVVDDDLLIGLRWILEDVAARGRSAAQPGRGLSRAVVVQPGAARPAQAEGADAARADPQRRAPGRHHHRRQDVRAGLDEQVAYAKALDEAGIPYFVSEFEESMTSFDHLQIQLETFVENMSLRLRAGRPMTRALSRTTPPTSSAAATAGRGAAVPRVVRRADRGGRSAATPAAYVFVMGSMAEILRVFDCPSVFPEINSLQTAVRRVAHEYLNAGRGLRLLAGHLRLRQGGRRPAAARRRSTRWGGFPKPAIAVLTNACNTYIKWAEIWERLYHIPVFTLDVPGTRARRRPDVARAIRTSRPTAATSPAKSRS